MAAETLTSLVIKAFQARARDFVEAGPLIMLPGLLRITALCYLFYYYGLRQQVGVVHGTRCCRSLSILLGLLITTS